MFDLVFAIAIITGIALLISRIHNFIAFRRMQRALVQAREDAARARAARSRPDSLLRVFRFFVLLPSGEEVSLTRFRARPCGDGRFTVDCTRAVRAAGLSLREVFLGNDREPHVVVRSVGESSVEMLTARRHFYVQVLDQHGKVSRQMRVAVYGSTLVIPGPLDAAVDAVWEETLRFNACTVSILTEPEVPMSQRDTPVSGFPSVRLESIPAAGVEAVDEGEEKAS